MRCFTGSPQALKRHTVPPISQSDRATDTRLSGRLSYQTEPTCYDVTASQVCHNINESTVRAMVINSYTVARRFTQCSLYEVNEVER